MTKGELIETILIRVNGGRITQDSKVKREDINALLSAAINWSVTGRYWINKKATGTNEYPSDFIASYLNVGVKTDTDRDLRYVDMPVGTLTLPDDQGTQSVSPMQGDDVYIATKFLDRKHNAYYHNTFAGNTRWWREQQKIFFLNLPDITDKVLLRLIQSAGNLNNDDELPISAGSEIDILNILNDWFTGQRIMPADMRPDNADVDIKPINEKNK